MNIFNFYFYKSTVTVIGAVGKAFRSSATSYTGMCHRANRSEHVENYFTDAKNNFA